MPTLVYFPNEVELKAHQQHRNLKMDVIVLGDLDAVVKRLKEDQFENIYFFIDSSCTIDQSFLFTVYKLLKAGGKFHIESQEEIKNAAIFDQAIVAGLTDVQIGGKTISASKPNWSGNSAPVSLKLKPKTQTNEAEGKTQTSNKENPFAKFKIDNSDLLDENALLKDDPSYSKLSTVENCSTKPKACKNCSCGRKELEELNDAQTVTRMLENNDVKSSCGNCYLGDAFRCSSCPYKGLPAFKPGDKIKLDLSKDTNALNASKEEGTTKVTGGKVKLDL